jgi:hypothetical protein
MGYVLRSGTENSFEELPGKHHAVFTVWRKWCCPEIESEVFAALSGVQNSTGADGSVLNGDPVYLVEFGDQKLIGVFP